nr:molybdopterin-dependent oxidoreductase [Dictyobacter formicarum]
MERGFPVLSAGPTPHAPLAHWDFSLLGEVKQPKRWTWDAFRDLPHETITKDIHCVTKWSKLDTHWEGVSVDTLLEQVEYDAHYVVAFGDGGYTINLPLADVLDGKAWVVYGYEGQPLSPVHGGPAHLLVPHLYFWKSAKWIRGLRLVDQVLFPFSYFFVTIPYFCMYLSKCMRLSTLAPYESKREKSRRLILS